MIALRFKLRMNKNSEHTSFKFITFLMNQEKSYNFYN